MLPRLSVIVALAALVLLPATASASLSFDGKGRHKLSVLLDLRLGVSARQTASRVGGVGLTRLGGEDTDGDGLGEKRQFRAYLGQLGLDFHGKIRRKTGYLIELNSQLDGNERTAVNIPEAFLTHEGTWNSAKLMFRGGLLIPPFSMENSGRSWSTFFTLTPSAINTWIGEEIRGYGLEGTYQLRLARSKRISMVAGAFSGNDVAGALLAWRGWALHDRQAGINDRTDFRGNPFLVSPAFFMMTNPYTRPFLEMDDNPGTYGLFTLDTTRAKFRYGAWANHADRGEREAARIFGWQAHFQHLAGRYETEDGRFLVQGQAMWGRYRMGRGNPARVENDYRAWYLMMSSPLPLARVSLRYDDFSIKDHDIYQSFDPNGQDGHAWTLAVTRPLNKTVDITAEVLSLRSKRDGNALLGASPLQRETQWQVAWRWYP